MIKLNGIIGAGVVGGVFQGDDGRAYKLLRRDISGSLPDELRLQLFKRELDACNIVAKLPELARHVPTFYGRTEVESATDTFGDVSGQYFLTHCLVFERLTGRPQRFEDAIRRFPRLAALAERFAKHGIDVWGSDVFRAPDQADIKIVDYCTVV